MTTTSMNRRLDSLPAGRSAGFSETLAAMREMSRAWYRSGEVGPVPWPQSPLAPLPPNATRKQREQRAELLRARARGERYRAGCAQ